MKKIRVIKKVVGEKAIVTTIDKDNLREHVGGGFIEIVPLGADIVLVVDEEGKLNGSKPNFDLMDDVIMGDCFFAGISYVDEERVLVSLTDEQIAMVLNGKVIDFTKEPKNTPKISWTVREF